jgi:hypothetical protein
MDRELNKNVSGVTATSAMNELTTEGKRMLICSTYAQPQAKRPEVVLESVSFLQK